MASLLEHVSLNKLVDQLNQAIEEVGGDVSEATGPFDYPDIIRDQLSAGSVVGGGSLKEGNGIVVEKDGSDYKISANAGATLIRDVNPPHNIDGDANVDVIPAGTSIQDALGIIVNDVLPTLPSLLKGDIIMSSSDGTDEYQNPNYTSTGIKSGLTPSTAYIRMFLASRKEPVYISCEPLGDFNMQDLIVFTEPEAKELFDNIFGK